MLSSRRMLRGHCNLPGQLHIGAPRLQAMHCRALGKYRGLRPIEVAQQIVQPTEQRTVEQSQNGSGLIQRGRVRPDQYTEQAYLTARTRRVAQHFPTSLGIDDFLNRLEIALFAYGFTGQNSIAMSNMCRDEITVTLKNKIDIIFGSSFNTNGLGGVLTCGVTGVKAGLSHSPISTGSGKERYVFLSFPHISVDALGRVGEISRPGRPGQSCACGALNAALGDIKAGGLRANCKKPGVHEALDPEYSILKQRLARRMRYEGIEEAGVQDLDLVAVTKLAERTILDDLEYLIRNSVDPKRADYAVISGVQIHSWGRAYDDEAPNLEYIAPSTVYAVVNGERTYLDLSSIPSLTPRQIRALSRVGPTDDRPLADDEVCEDAGNTTTVRSVAAPYAYNSRERRRAARARAATFATLIQESDDDLEGAPSCAWPGGWQSRIKQDVHKLESDSSVSMDESFEDADAGKIAQGEETEY